MTIETYPPVKKTIARKSNAGRKTDAQRNQIKIESLQHTAALEAEQRRLDREAKIDAARVEPMSADTRPIQWTILVGVIIIGLAAFAISYGAVYEVAGWTGWAEWQKILTPLLLDAGIVVFTFLSFNRMEKRQGYRITFALAEALTAISSFAQVAHTLTTSPRTGVELVVACGISVLPPLILSASSYLAGKTIFRQRDKEPGL